MRTIYAITVLCVLLLCCVGCGKDTEKVETAAQDIVTALTEGNMERINEIIFNTRELIVDKELEELRDNSEPNDNKGILEMILEQDKIRLENVTENAVQYEITVPDMQHALQNLGNAQEHITEEELKVYLEEYAKNAKSVTIEVKVPYEMKDENVYIHYQTEDFINALTGGLLRSYQQLYQGSLSEYQREVQK